MFLELLLLGLTASLAFACMGPTFQTCQSDDLIYFSD